MSNQLSILDRLMSPQIVRDKVYRRRLKEYERQYRKACWEHRQRDKPQA